MTVLVPRGATLPMISRQVARCEACGDSGIVSLDPRAPIDPDRLWTRQMPCACPAGDQWRAEARAEGIDGRWVACACGERARFGLLSETPLCPRCDFAARRSA